MGQLSEKMSISIIIPVYNSEKYLRACLDSVINQTFKDMEIICIDDGSTDGSGAILAEYARLDARIRAIEKPNTGYGHSMNVGIEAAKGEYIGIVESDDVVLPEFYETLFKTASDNDLDIVKSECFFWWEDADYMYRFHIQGLDEYYGKLIPKQKAWIRCRFLMNTWTGLYKREFLNECGIRHHESPGASYQDNGFWMQGMLMANRMMVLDYAGYLYRQDNEFASIRDRRKVYAMSEEYEWLGKLLVNNVSSADMDVINYFRLTRGYWNLIRIADECKRSFCDRLLYDYNIYGEVLSIDTIWRERFEKIKDNPDEFCGRIISQKREVKEKLDTASSIVIYGAGYRGEKILRILFDYGWFGKLKCFIETDLPQMDRIGKTPVVQVKKDIIGDDRAIVIISAAHGTKTEIEMRSELEINGITNVMGSDTIIDNYYVVC